jgi:hypothetical protein
LKLRPPFAILGITGHLLQSFIDDLADVPAKGLNTRGHRPENVGIFNDLIEVVTDLIDAFEIGGVAALAGFDDKAFSGLVGELTRKIIVRDTSTVSLVGQPLEFRIGEAEDHLAATPLGCGFFWSWHVNVSSQKKPRASDSVEGAVGTFHSFRGIERGRVAHFTRQFMFT